jgi:excisionase family DNA binding protein
MSAIALKFDPAPDPSRDDIEAAREAARVLTSRSSAAGVRLTVDCDKPDHAITLPRSILSQIVDLLIKLGNGQTVTIMPVGADLTTTQAAEVLGVSRPHVIKLIERGDLAFRLVGTHRKLAVRDVLAYVDRRGHARAEQLRAISHIDIEAGFDADEAVGQKAQ